MTVLFIAFAQITALIDLQPELQYDAVQYSQLVDAFRGAAPAQLQTPFMFRILPAAIVAASGLDVLIGFYALDMAALLATGLLLMVLLREHTTPVGALAAVVIWSLLPYGLRFAIHYPILNDFLGAFLFTALLLVVQARRYVLFAGLLIAAVLTREALVMCAPWLLLRVLPEASRRTAVRATLAAVPGLAALAVVHLWPPFVAPVSGATTTEYVGFVAHHILTNYGGEGWRVLAAPLFAYGVLVGPICSRRAVALLRSEPGWSYLLVAEMITAALGGGDHDRYLFAIAPLILLVTVRAIPKKTRSGVLLILIPLQVIAGRLLMPLGPDWATHSAFGVSFISLDALAAWSAAIAGCGILAALVVVAARRAEHVDPRATARVRRFGTSGR
jgi:hypothetical protein